MLNTKKTAITLLAMVIGICLGMLLDNAVDAQNSGIKKYEYTPEFFHLSADSHNPGYVKMFNEMGKRGWRYDHKLYKDIYVFIKEEKKQN